MATAGALFAVVGLSVHSEAVRALVAADALVDSTEADLEEGESPRSYWSGPASGYELVHCRGRVTSAFLYAEPTDGFAAFSGLLPGGVPQGATRRQVLALFGTPERSGEATTIAPLGRQGPWDRFAVGGVRIHFQYNEPFECVQLVSIMTADVAP